ncbi:MAG: phage shock protein operon transcriptional activator [Gammaproteobacteria bacterium]|nr:phage shock protein operon transcriptional activator [Gammaproteobacteria bacterium]
MRNEPERLLGEAPAFLGVLEAVSQIAPLEKPVLIVGERGTGKELIAERLHFLSNRWEGHYLKMNCAAIADSLLESELFGHEAGAFTGASRTHQGRFERAHGGTLFLDELANTSGLVQEKLLRVIEYGEFERVGGKKTLQCDVRLVAATNEDLPRLADAGKFRHDLLDRLAFDVITLPPLRERPGDVLMLAEHFAINMSAELGREMFAGFSPSAGSALQEYPWPGNVRELKNVVERCVYRSEAGEPVEEIVFDPFDSPYRPSSRTIDGKAATADTDPAPRANEPIRAAGAGTGAGGDGAAGPARHSWSNDVPVDLRREVRDYEIAAIHAALEAARHNQRKAAELLKLTYHQFRGYLKKYEILKQD